MITYHSTNLDFDATFQGDFYVSGGVTIARAYTRSKSMLRLERLDAQKLSIYGIYFTSDGGTLSTVKYYSNPNGILEIPLRNFINKLHGSSNVAIHVLLYEVGTTTQIDTLSFRFDIFKGVLFADANPPMERDISGLNGDWYPFVLPPNVIINTALLSGQNAPGIIVESNYLGFEPDYATFSVGTGGIFSTLTPTGERNSELVIPYTVDTLVLEDTKNHIKHRWNFEIPSSCADVVCVRWTSMTGAVRQHYFPIVNFIKGSDKQVSIVSSGDGYLVDKNQYNAVQCRLTGLTRYGYWYYMDLLQATDVHAIIRQGDAPWATEIASEQTAAFVENTETETPEGVGFFNFEFTLKLRHYGTL